MASRRRQKPANPPRKKDSATPKRQVFWVPLVLTLGLAMASLVPRAQDSRS
jgi:hypothetical protein